MIRTSAGVVATLSFVSAGLCGVLLLEFMESPSLDGNVATPVSLQTTRSSNGSQSGPQLDGWMRDTLARPIFSPDRRPVEVSGRQAGGFRLTGIIVSDLGKVAIFAKPGARTIVLEEGGEIDGSRVLEVTQAEVVVVGPNGRTVMTPLYDPAPRPRPPLPIPIKAEVRP